MSSIKDLPPEDQDKLIANWLEHDANPDNVLREELDDIKLKDLFIDWLMYRNDSILILLREAMIERIDGEDPPDCTKLTEDLLTAHKGFIS